MTKRGKSKMGTLSEQLSLMDMLPTEEGSMNISLLLKDSLSRAMRKSKLSRWQIAGKISELAGRSLSKEMLDAYVSESKDGYRFPAELLPAFCLVVEDLGSLRILAEKIGASVLDPKDAEYVEVARIEREKAELEKILREKKVKLGI